RSSDLPTFYELAGTAYPGNTASKKIKPLLGKTIVPLLNGESSIHSEEYVTGLEHRGRMFVRKGNWKLVNLQPPLDNKKLMLFNVAEDLGETKDLSKNNPEKFEELLMDWKDFVKKNEILLHQVNQ
ncbi:MAG TPA: sulfatase, partial [Cytophagales bacterium]|nr:sulfatase [Cytophagales bacterium]